MNTALEELSGRIRDYLHHRTAPVEKRMFGGVAFMVRGNMVVAAMKDGSMLTRVGKEGMEAALARPGCNPMHMRGREVSGFVAVDGDVLEDEDTLIDWLDTALAFAATLPAK